MHTTQTFMEMKEKLDETARDVPADLEEMQLMTGLNRNTDSFIWDP